MSTITAIQSTNNNCHSAHDVCNEPSVKQLEAPKGENTGDKKESCLRKIINLFASVILFIPRGIWKCASSLCNKISDCCGKSTKDGNAIESKNVAAEKTAAAAAEQGIVNSNDPA